MDVVSPQTVTDWLSEDAENGFHTADGEVKIITADNGLAYILDTNAVHQINGTETGGGLGQVSSNVLLFPGYFNLIDGVDYRGNIFIAVNQFVNQPSNNYVSECGVYAWDRLTSTSRMQDYISIKGAREIRNIFIAPNGRLRAFTIAANGITELRELYDSEFRVVKEIGFDAYPQYKNSISIAGNLTYWLGVDGKFYCYGSFEPEEDEALVILNEIDTTATGAILFGGGDTVTGVGHDNFYLSYTDDSTPVVDKLEKYYVNPSSATVESTAIEALKSEVLTPVKYFPVMSSINSIKIVGAPSASTSTDVIAKLNFYANNSSTAFLSKNVTATDWMTGYLHLDLNKHYAHSFQIGIEFQNLAIGTNDFRPAFAEVDTTPTGGKG
jgi:hypothetical protein